jgi:hypothetical protein
MNVQAAVQLIDQIKPEGALQSMLVTQMIGVHNTAIKFLMRASLSDQTFEAIDAAKKGSEEQPAKRAFPCPRKEVMCTMQRFPAFCVFACPRVRKLHMAHRSSTFQGIKHPESS